VWPYPSEVYGGLRGSHGNYVEEDSSYSCLDGRHETSSIQNTVPYPGTSPTPNHRKSLGFVPGEPADNTAVHLLRTLTGEDPCYRIMYDKKPLINIMS